MTRERNLTSLSRCNYLRKALLAALVSSSLIVAACASSSTDSTPDAVRGGTTLQDESLGGPNDPDNIHARDAYGTSSASTTSAKESAEMHHQEESAMPSTRGSSSSSTNQKAHSHPHKKRQHMKQHKAKPEGSGAARERNLLEDDLVTPPQKTTTSAATASPPASATSTMELSPAELNYFYEPQSQQPEHVGSTEITGKDKSLAALERNNTMFIDAAAKVRATASREATEPLAQVDFEKYGHGERGLFASDMRSRLENIDHGLDTLRLRAHATSGLSRRESLRQIDALEAERESVEASLEQASRVESVRWSEYRGDFRSQISALESTFESLSAEVR